MGNRAVRDEEKNRRQGIRTFGVDVGLSASREMLAPWLDDIDKNLAGVVAIKLGPMARPYHEAECEGESNLRLFANDFLNCGYCLCLLRHIEDIFMGIFSYIPTLYHYHFKALRFFTINRKFLYHYSPAYSNDTTTFLALTPFCCMSIASCTFSSPFPTTSGSGAATYFPFANASGKKSL